MNFVPLHVYSGYSFLKSGLTVEKYIEAAKKEGYASLALSDYENMSGAFEFVKACKEASIKPIIGEDILLDGFLFTFLVKNETGYRNLLKINYLANAKTLTLEEAINNKEGLITIVSVAQEGLYERFCTDENAFTRTLKDLSCKFTDFYLGLDNYQDDDMYLDEIRAFANKYNYQTVAFPHVLYVKKDDAIILKMVEAIANEERIEIKKFEGNNYLLSKSDIEHIFTKEEIDTTFKIAQQIDFELEIKRGKMPHFNNELNMSSDDYLVRVANESLKRKGLDSEPYQKRLTHELEVIKKMGYSDYFLIVSDYVSYAKKVGIPVGPGRGSAPGSLVSFVLDITNPDPLKYDLLFERFLNVGRQSMPDIDIDFSDIRRNEIVEYLRHKYGNDHVANIATIQTIGPKQSLRDIGRIYGYETREIDLISKLITDSSMSLRENYKHNIEFRKLIDSDKYYLQIVSLASKIEGLPRQGGLHAAGIVLSEDSLIDTLPLYVDYEQHLTEQYEMNYLEEQGFLKMDLLGLRNLTIIEDCLNRLKVNNINLKDEDIPHDDKKAIELIKSAMTMGIFQLESAGMRRAIKELKPESFDDIVALLALYRPGPMANIPHYAKRKAGLERIVYISDCLKEILEPTYGIIVYQEQIMQIASKMAGFSLSEADLFRRAISKKDSKKLAMLKKSFIEGSLKNNISQKEAENVFNLIYRFADYGFNKSHSLSYAILSSKMAYLKAHYKEAFYASILDHNSIDGSAYNLTISEIKNAGIRIKNPNINESTKRYEIANNSLLMPLTSIKGLLSSLVDSIIKERNIKPFEDFFDFVLRMNKYRISATQVMKLIDAGVFDTLDKSRASLRINIPSAFNYASMLNNDEGITVIDVSLFAKPTYQKVADDLADNLKREYDALGMMISGSPLSLVKNSIKDKAATNIIDIASTNGTITLVAIIKNIKTVRTKAGKPMAFINVFDDTNELEITVFSDIYESYYEALKKNNIVVIEGYYQKHKDSFVAAKITRLETN